MTTDSIEFDKNSCNFCSSGPYRPYWIVMSFLFSIFIYLMTIGVRGSDQYWYISDLKSLLSPVFSGSNCLYPVPFLHGFYSKQISVPFMHHTLTLYLAYPFGFLFGEFNGFLTYNIVMALVASSLLSCTIGRYTNKKIATLAYGSILFYPLTFWQTANLLQEITIFAFIAAVMAFGLYSIGNSNLTPISRRSWQTISIIGILVHPIFIFLSTHAVLYDIYLRRRKSIFNVIVTLIVIISILKIKHVLFPNSYPPSLIDLASCHQPNRNNMAYFFYFDQFQPTLHWITYQISSFWKNLFRLTPINSTTILIPAGIISFVGLYYQKFKWWEFITTMFVFLLLPWGAMCIIHQFQTRYILILAPPLLVGVWYFIHNLAINNNKTNKLVVIISSIFICMMIIIDVLFIGNILKRSTREESQYCNSIKTVFKGISNKDRIIFSSGDETIGKSLMFSYAVWPRLVLTRIENSDTQIDAHYENILFQFKPQWLVSPENIKNQTHPNAIKIKKIGRLGKYKYFLYKLT